MFERIHKEEHEQLSLTQSMVSGQDYQWDSGARASKLDIRFAHCAIYKLPSAGGKVSWKKVKNGNLVVVLFPWVASQGWPAANCGRRSALAQVQCGKGSVATRSALTTNLGE